MRLHIPNIDPYVHGLIKQHQAEHGHKNQKETVECLIKMAMIDCKEFREFQTMVEKEISEGKRDVNGRVV